MSALLPRHARAIPQRGGISLTALVLGGAVVLLAALLYVTLSGPNDPQDPLPEVPDPQQQVVQTSPDGEPLEAGTLEIREGGPLPGLGPLEVSLHYLGKEGDTQLRKERPGRLEGVVYGPDGKGLADARVEILRGPEAGTAVISDADGRYLFPELVPGTHFFRIRSSRTPDAGRMQRVLSKAQTRRDFFVGQALTIQLRVRGHEGKTITGAELDFDFGVKKVKTDDKGVALVESVAAGRRVVVGIEADGHVPVRYELNLFPQMQNGEVIDLPPLPQGGRLRGKVASWPGGPLPTVTLVPQGTTMSPYLYQWERWQDLPTTREGSFRFDNLPTTELLNVRVAHPWGPCEPRSRSVRPGVSAAATVQFLIREDKAQVSGVVKQDNGEVLSGATLTLEAARPAAVLEALYPGLTDSPLSVALPQPAALRREVRSDQHGAFRFALGDHPQGTGHMLLTASAKGRETIRREVRTVGQEFSLVLREEALAASLALTRSDGGPIPPAKWLLEGKLQTRPNGRLEDLPQGNYHVVIRRGDLELLRLPSFAVDGSAALDLARF